jgi:Mn2+/Fe2+ NRAMP family transporter
MEGDKLTKEYNITKSDKLTRRGKLTNKIRKFFLIVGGGIFLLGYNIGTGSVVTMSKSGALYGTQLLWDVLLSCIFTFVLMIAYGKTTIITGRTSLTNFRLKFQKYNVGTILSIYIIIALIIGEWLSLYGMVGIISDLIRIGFHIIGVTNVISPIWIALIMVVILYAIFWRGDYNVFEKFLVLLVLVMAISFIVVFFMIKPDFAAIGRGFIPSMPATNESAKIIAAIAGTTVSAAVFVIRSIVVAEKNWTEKNINDEKKDSLFSASMMFILSAIIMIVAAGTLHVMGLKVNNTADLIHLFAPIGGKLAAFILIIGVCAAGISSMFPISLIAPWLICDFRDQERDAKSPLFRGLGLVAFLFAFGMQFLGKNPPFVIVTAMAFQALILPAVVIPIIILMHDKKFMKGHKNSIAFDIGLGACLIFSLITAYLSVTGLINAF